MTTNIIRILYGVLGFVIGLIAAIIFTNQIHCNYVLAFIGFTIFGILIALAIEDGNENMGKKVFCFILSLIFVYPIAYVYQYVVVFLIVVGRFIKAIIF